MQTPHTQNSERHKHSAYTLSRVSLPPPHTFMHIHIHTYTLSHVHNLTIHTHIRHSQWHIHVRMHTHTQCAHTLVHRNTHICACSHTQRQTCTITHVHADPDALTHAWTHVLLNMVLVSSLRIHVQSQREFVSRAPWIRPTCLLQEDSCSRESVRVRQATCQVQVASSARKFSKNQIRQIQGKAG